MVNNSTLGGSRSKEAFDLSSLAHMLPHAGIALGLHVGGNALLKVATRQL